MELKERQLSQEIQSLIYKNTTSAVENQKGVTTIFQRAHQLESSLQQLKKENKSLREKLEITELNMQSFVREMTGMMDSHELGSSLGDILGWGTNEGPTTTGDHGTTTGGSNRRGGKH